jgi:hypothetical protein
MASPEHSRFRRDAVAGDLGIFRVKLDQDCVTLEPVSD